MLKLLFADYKRQASQSAATNAVCARITTVPQIALIEDYFACDIMLIKKYLLIVLVFCLGRLTQKQVGSASFLVRFGT
ncbi:MAG TPA: hypothetical protein PLH64_07630, partial [Anaerolineaceae bacterium]|nr:hypothetical protein [Anaerolineaceae bacterium]